MDKVSNMEEGLGGWIAFRGPTRALKDLFCTYLFSPVPVLVQMNGWDKGSLKVISYSTNSDRFFPKN